MSVRVAALLTTHNRVEKTLTCLAALAQQEAIDAAIDVVLCDAGSTDGTVEQVRAQFPDAVVLEASADHFWNAGMRRAFEYAVRSDYDFYLWLNDDTVLDPTALATLLRTYQHPAVRPVQPAIIVGAVRDPDSGALTYGGVSRTSSLRPLRFQLVPPGARPTRVDTMNGNVVLLPREIVRLVGLLDPVFTHGMGDFDYGLRARKVGGSVWLAPGTLGECAKNPIPRPAPSLKAHLQRLSGPKGLPPREWARFARRWAGPLWPVYALSPFLRRTLAWARSLG